MDCLGRPRLDFVPIFVFHLAPPPWVGVACFWEDSCLVWVVPDLCLGLEAGRLVGELHLASASVSEVAAAVLVGRLWELVDPPEDRHPAPPLGFLSPSGLGVSAFLSKRV